ncbi:unnamed protein product [Thelazia callipaeda]|uniref:Tyrosine-protein phosphatase domain-containing protein n=1 Tax=Thelazia callipaeda TaxID=103827 RepID=A0A0N5D7D8_THECL|nr:unnamed protein product [Thelazia callipaeda]
MNIIYIIKDASIRRGSSSVQKLVKGEKITDFAHSYFFFKSNLIKTLKLQHEFLWKMEFHISEFCRSEVLKQGKNRTSTVVNFNEGAVRLVPTMSEDSCYIHASRINLPYGNFIIAQGPTQTSLIDFFRMLWQYRIPLVVCLDSLTNQDTCYRYFSTKRQQAVKASDRITIETTGIMETTVPNLFIYEAVITNTEIKSGSNHRIIHIVHYDKWEGENTISPQVLVKIITIMKTMSDKFDQKSIVVHGSNGIKRSVVYVLTSVLMQQITKFRRLSVLSAPIAVCKRRYGALRSVDDYRLVLQSALCFAKQCELITDMKKYENAMEVSIYSRSKFVKMENYHPRLDSRSYIRICTTDIGGKECEQTMTNCVI